MQRTSRLQLEVLGWRIHSQRLFDMQLPNLKFNVESGGLLFVAGTEGAHMPNTPDLQQLPGWARPVA